MSTNYISQITASNGTTYDIQEGVTTRLFRATCPTAAGTAAKVATLDDATGYSLATGVRVAVTFTYGNSATTPTLNVNSGGAKNIVVPTAVSTLTSGNGTTYNTWGPYETVIFTYNGSQWVNSGSGYAIANSFNYNNLSNKPTIPTVPSNIVNTITTSAGAHTTISSKTGSVSFNVPTKTSHLTNDSGFITSYTDTNTTYTLSNALSSHKFTSTLTAGGSGSGTSTATMTFAAGTGIKLTDDTTNKKITIASSITVPTITLNGSATTSPSFYAPTSAGTSGYILKSNGSGAPTWIDSESILPGYNGVYSNTVFAGDKAADGFTPVFRKLVSADIPDLSSRYLPLSGGTMTGPITMAHGVSNAVYGTLQDGSSTLPMLCMTYGTSTVENYIALGATNNNIPVGIYGSNVYLTNGGTLTLQGDITVEGHETPIGDVAPKANKTQNIATGNSWVTTGCSVSLTKGVWVVVGSIEYAANATGRRGVEIYANGHMTHTQVNVAAGSNATTRLVTAGILEITVASMNVYIYGYQNSGSSLSQTTYMRAVRIR